MMLYVVWLIVIGSLVFPPWAIYRHFDAMDNDPEYRRRARQKGL